MSGRTFFIGDVHGCDVALQTLLETLALTADDTAVFLGDLIDRGPDSNRVIEQIVELQKTCHVEVVLGNHEEMLLNALEGQGAQQWLKFGGASTLESYGGTLAKFPATHLELLCRAVPYWQNDTHIAVHANLEPEVELSRQQPEWLRWQRLTGMEYPHSSGRLIVCGHSGIMGGWPAVRDGWVCLDTLAYKGGYLTCLEGETGMISQTQQSGATRLGVRLSDLA